MIFVVVLSFLCAANSAPIEIRSLSGSRVYQVIPTTLEDVKWIKSVGSISGLQNVTVLTDRFTEGNPVDIVVPADAEKIFTTTLLKRKLQFQLKTKNLQKLIDAERGSASANFRFRSASQFDLRAYHSHEEVNGYLKFLNTKRPNITELVDIGKSFEGRQMLALKIGKPGIGKREIWIDAGIHAREWLSVTTATYILAQMVLMYDSDSNIHNLVDTIDWYILPIVNPDGYEYSRTTNRLWRKNRSTGRGHCIGVDLNRNFPYDFGGMGTSSNECEEIFRGDAALSEPESHNLAKFIESHNDTLHAYVTLHSYSQMWMIPYGNVKPISKPDNFETLMSVAKEAAKAVLGVNGYSYKVENSATLLGPAAGASDDWAMSRGIPFVYTVELRPDDSTSGFSGFGFIATADQILPTGREIFEGIKVVGKRVSQFP